MTCPDFLDPIWTLCDLLREDGLKDKDCVGELAQLLFLKLAHEASLMGVWAGSRRQTGDEWPKLGQHTGDALLPAWRSTLQRLAHDADPLLAAAFVGAQTRIQSPALLQALMARLEALDWASLRGQPPAPTPARKAKAGGKAKAPAPASAAASQAAVLADLFDRLLARADERPRALVDALVRCLAPQAGESVQDPVAGTAGFLVAAQRFVAGAARPAGDVALAHALGLEAQPATRRLALMNCWLHGVAPSAEVPSPVQLGNALGEAGAALPEAQVLLCHAPSGTASGAMRTDLPLPTRNKALALLQHAMRKLQVGGRAAVVLPDELLRSGGVAAELRRTLLDEGRLHTLLRLPLDVLAVPSSVLFFGAAAAPGSSQAGEGEGTGIDLGAAQPAQVLWVFDMRLAQGAAQASPLPSAPVFGLLPGRGLKPAQASLASKAGDAAPAVSPALWDEFVSAYGQGAADTRPASAQSAHWRCFTRAWLREQLDDRLDISWLPTDAIDLTGDDAAWPPAQPGERAQAAMDELKAAFAALDAVMAS